jgi:hypothetical protein
MSWLGILIILVVIGLMAYAVTFVFKTLGKIVRLLILGAILFLLVGGIIGMYSEYLDYHSGDGFYVFEESGAILGAFVRTDGVYTAQLDLSSIRDELRSDSYSMIVIVREAAFVDASMDREFASTGRDYRELIKEDPGKASEEFLKVYDSQGTAWFIRHLKDDSIELQPATSLRDMADYIPAKLVGG